MSTYGTTADTNAFIADVANRRGMPTPGGNPIRWVELHDGEHVEMLAYEPDPLTYRKPYYYNTEQNVLYRRVKEPGTPTPIAYWKRVSSGW